MPPSIRKTGDMCRELGLICTFTRSAQDRELKPKIWSLYKSLEAISYAYSNDDLETIRLEYLAIDKISDLFLAPYGPREWAVEGTERPGVAQ